MRSFYKSIAVAFATSTLMVAGFFGPVAAQDDRVNTLTQNISRADDYFSMFLLRDAYLIQVFPSTIFEYPSHAMVQSPSIGDSTISGSSGYASFTRLISAQNNTSGSSTDVSYRNAYGFYLGNRTGLFSRGNYAPLQAVVGRNYGAIRFALLTGVQISNSAATQLADFGLALAPSLTGLFSNNLGFDASIPFHVSNAAYKRTDLDDSVRTEVMVGFSGRFRSKTLSIPVKIANKSIRHTWNTVGDIGTEITDNALLVDFGIGKNFEYTAFGVPNNIVCQASGALITNSSSSVQTQPGMTNLTTSSESSTIFLHALFGDEVSIGKYWMVRFGQSFIIGQYTSAGSSNSFMFGMNGMFTSGFGFHWRSLTLDASVGTDLLSNGPYLLTGKPSGFAPSFNVKFDF